VNLDFLELKSTLISRESFVLLLHTACSVRRVKIMLLEVSKKLVAIIRLYSDEQQENKSAYSKNTEQMIKFLINGPSFREMYGTPSLCLKFKSFTTTEVKYPFHGEQKY
jgi:hypothetical protein